MTTDSADAARAELESFIYRISHDLRASVRALMELPDWIVEDLQDLGCDLPEDTVRCTMLMKSHARRLDAMMVGLLDYSRVGRKQSVGEVDAAAVVERAVAGVDWPEGMEVAVRAEPARLRCGEADLPRLVGELLRNAQRHVRAEAPRVEVTAQVADGHWRLRVADNGQGIPERDAETIFKPMVKLVSRDEDEGGGMGLAIVQKTAEAWGGHAWVERSETGGAAFVVALPLEPVP